MKTAQSLWKDLIWVQRLSQSRCLSGRLLHSICCKTYPMPMIATRFGQPSTCYTLYWVISKLRAQYNRQQSHMPHYVPCMQVIPEFDLHENELVGQHIAIWMVLHWPVLTYRKKATRKWSIRSGEMRSQSTCHDMLWDHGPPLVL